MDRAQRWVTSVWLLLSIATIVTTWGLSKDSVTAATATIATILIAAWKVRMVLLHFMELDHAPWRVRLLFESWTVLVAVVILAPYFLAPLLA
ncbi:MULTISPECIES: cytochrome C oxidase subunit IV family protein [unclassified Pseudomonas]|uniref:cytochrome C oxidase subunit IV family protein n=1 Tax=unclassified Pseudomonas TaxID=196821 RepID=UPI00087151A3|nr:MULTISPECIES: cytochrome C oxidase subunit IV family protein [unclassified Pseudomonas]SCW31207.1 Cytochrome C oxidase subunit IV [Pseudomonas sp. NFACC05-1]SDY54155.1 Cytochrome C oxidase subunit IV [Pseudomonas sp. NFACC08-1]SEI49910.1 Cytochrome C oxidase subunit IV [Pseudomonas sp. NFACC07-1]SFL07205.1 Cytochrome C oxidase subunit IV [Pseudomonas sp. NFACC46-3]